MKDGIGWAVIRFLCNDRLLSEFKIFYAISFFE